jgi:hypothetical protein
MIKNQRQYRISKAQAAKFRAALDTLRRTPARSIHPVLLKAQRQAMESQLGDLTAEVSEYEAVQAGRRRVLQLRIRRAVLLEATSQ